MGVLKRTTTLAFLGLSVMAVTVHKEHTGVVASNGVGMKAPPSWQQMEQARKRGMLKEEAQKMPWDTLLDTMLEGSKHAEGGLAKLGYFFNQQGPAENVPMTTVLDDYALREGTWAPPPDATGISDDWTEKGEGKMRGADLMRKVEEAREAAPRNVLADADRALGGLGRAIDHQVGMLGIAAEDLQEDVARNVGHAVEDIRETVAPAPQEVWEDPKESKVKELAEIRPNSRNVVREVALAFFNARVEGKKGSKAVEKLRRDLVKQWGPRNEDLVNELVEKGLEMSRKKKKLNEERKLWTKNFSQDTINRIANDIVMEYAPEQTSEEVKLMADAFVADAKARAPKVHKEFIGDRDDFIKQFDAGQTAEVFQDDDGKYTFELSDDAMALATIQEMEQRTADHQMAIDAAELRILQEMSQATDVATETLATLDEQREQLKRIKQEQTLMEVDVKEAKKLYKELRRWKQWLNPVASIRNWAPKILGGAESNESAAKRAQARNEQLEGTEEKMKTLAERKAARENGEENPLNSAPATGRGNVLGALRPDETPMDRIQALSATMKLQAEAMRDEFKRQNMLVDEVADQTENVNAQLHQAARRMERGREADS